MLVFASTNLVSDRLKGTLIIPDSLVVLGVHGAFNQCQSWVILHNSNNIQRFHKQQVPTVNRKSYNRSRLIQLIFETAWADVSYTETTKKLGSILVLLKVAYSDGNSSGMQQRGIWILVSPCLIEYACVRSCGKNIDGSEADGLINARWYTYEQSCGVDAWCWLSICRFSLLLSNFFKTGKEVISGALKFFLERARRTTPLLK